MNINNNQSSLKQMLQSKYASSRMNLLLVVGFTVINIILLITNSNSYFLFSAYIPYALIDLGMYLCGRYPQELYEDYGNIEFVNDTFFATMVVIALVIVLVYFLCWLFSKKYKVGWLIAALVLFGIDTLGMLAFLDFSSDIIIDIAFHIWVIISLSIGISNYFKLKKIPDGLSDVAIEIPDNVNDENLAEEQTEQEILKNADFSVKSRVLAEGQVLGYTIIYRRVKRTNELIVNGVIYDQIEALVETAHTLTAEVDGHKITAEYDGKLHSIIKVDNEIIAKKLRLF
ncbi:MAG: hypothetical protein E7551_07665 [Ruminococcaceae bacterium]|nr:hypothetical protein [Oscillospiraceae bacterium]